MCTHCFNAEEYLISNLFTAISSAELLRNFLFRLTEFLKIFIGHFFYGKCFSHFTGSLAADG